MVPTQEIVNCYGLIGLLAGAPLNEVRQAHRDLLKHWDPSRSPEDAQFQKTASAKTKELNDSLTIITSYLAGPVQAVRATPPAAQEQPKPEPERTRSEPAQKQRSSEERQPAPKAPQKPVIHPALAAGNQEGRRPMMWVLAGAGASIALTVLIGLLVYFFVIRQGPPLTNESTAANWIRASIKTKRAYCRAILFEMEHQQIPRKMGIRVNEDFFYEGLETISRQQEPAELNVKLVDLCTKLMAEKGRPGSKGPDQN